MLPPPQRDEPAVGDLSGQRPVAPDLAVQADEVGGVSRCPQCGSSEVEQRGSEGLLVCLFCRHEWAEARFEVDDDLLSLDGTTAAAGASAIDSGADLLVTLRCGGCGAEVVINTDDRFQARCHWCRHVLSADEHVPNGAVPDAVLPFKVTQDDAFALMTGFVRSRRQFADRKFLRDFKLENVAGVFIPYMVVDAKASAKISGQGEVRSGDGGSAAGWVDVFEVTRRVDFTVDDLTIEATSERSYGDPSFSTNNVVNTVLPFDTENAVEWDSRFLDGFTSERRDQDVAHLKPVLSEQLLSTARDQASASVGGYDRGVRWEEESLHVYGSHWVCMHLPVWLYSFYDVEDGVGMVHYIAVNGRTGEVMGSVPVSKTQRFASAAAFGAAAGAGVLAAGWVLRLASHPLFFCVWLLVLAGVVVRVGSQRHGSISALYRNAHVSHRFEAETRVAAAVSGSDRPVRHEMPAVRIGEHTPEGGSGTGRMYGANSNAPRVRVGPRSSGPSSDPDEVLAREEDTEATERAFASQKAEGARQRAVGRVMFPIGVRVVACVPVGSWVLTGLPMLVGAVLVVAFLLYTFVVIPHLYGVTPVTQTYRAGGYRERGGTALLYADVAVALCVVALKAVLI